MRFLLTLLLFTLIISCSENEGLSKITLVENSELDSLSIRAIVVKNENDFYFSGSESSFGMSNDGGETWNISNIDTLNQEFRSLVVLDSSILMMNIGSPAKVYRSTDLGSTWNVTFVDSAKTAFYNSMKFWDENNGIATGDPQQEGCLSVILTSDGGETWNKVPCDKLPKLDKGEAQFAASNTCVDAIDGNIWITTGGMNSRIIRSLDAGESWELINIDFVKGEEMTGIYTIDFYDKNNGVIFGGDWNKKCKSNNNKFYTSDGGSTWTNGTSDDRVCYRSCVQYTSDKNKVIALGIPGISLSEDGGRTWRNINDEKNFYTLRVINDSTALIAGKGKIGKISF